MTLPSSASALASAVRTGKQSAAQTVDRCFQRIEKGNPRLNAFSQKLAERARIRAQDLDQQLARGEDPGPLTGVPFAVKNLFDIRGLTTLAGARINADNPAATRDAVLIQRLEGAGAILVGALAMGEYAYDFTGENSHYGNCVNPHDPSRMSGGSSAGSGAAVGAGLVPLSLGSDTNGSIRVPASLCGVFGLKPTYGRLPRTGSYPFCDSLDHLGPLARTVEDLALAFDALQGFDAGDHACVPVAPIDSAAQLHQSIDGLRISRAGGYFDCSSFPQAAAAVDKVCRALAVKGTVELPGTLEGRSAAYLITNAEGGALHKTRLQQRSGDFDPDTRDRFIAGALLPGEWYLRAQQVRQWYHDQVLKVFERVDVIVAAATPCVAPKSGEKFLTIGGQQQLLRPNLGYFTQPISAIGLPSLVVPTVDQASGLPIGVQIIAPPWREDWCLQVAQHLEQQGFVAPPAPAT